MRKLTEQEKEVCDKAYWEWPGCGDGRLHYVPIAFEAGFVAGLDYAAGQGDHQRLEIAKQVEELQAECDEARAEVERLRAEQLETRRELTGMSRAWREIANSHYCKTYNGEYGRALINNADVLKEYVKGLRCCAIFGR